MTDQDITATADVAELLNQAASAQERFQIMYCVLRDIFALRLGEMIRDGCFFKSVVWVGGLYTSIIYLIKK